MYPVLQGEPGLKEEVVVPPLPDRNDPSKPLDASKPCLHGWRNILKEKGPAAFAKAVREYPGCLIMDTTWREILLNLIIKPRCDVVLIRFCACYR